MTAKIAPSARPVDVLNRQRHLRALYPTASANELGVLRFLMASADFRTGGTFVLAKTIAMEMNLSERTVRSALKTLRELGAIQWGTFAVRDGRKNLYRVVLGRPVERVDVCEIGPANGDAIAAVAPSSDPEQATIPPSIPPHELELEELVAREVCEGGEEEQAVARPVAGGNSGGNAGGPVRRSEDDRIRGIAWTRAECMLALKYWFTRVYPMLDARECDYACDGNVAELRRFVRFGCTPAEWREAVDGIVASPFRIRSVRIVVDHRHELIKLGRVTQRVEQHRRRELAPAPEAPPMDMQSARAAAAAALAALEAA